jgi:hypothetical protein
MEDAFTLVTPLPPEPDPDGTTFAEYQVSDEFLRKLPPARAEAKRGLSDELYEQLADVDPLRAERVMWRKRMDGQDAMWFDMRYIIVYEPDGLLRIGRNMYAREYDPAFIQKVVDRVLYVLYNFAFPKRTEREAMSKIARSTGMPGDLTMDVMKKYFGGRRRKTNRRSKKRRTTKRT